jgi:hypothetical protein
VHTGCWYIGMRELRRAQASVTAGLRGAPASDPLSSFAHQSWSLPFALQRTSAFGDAAGASGGFNGRVVSPQVRRPAEWNRIMCFTLPYA